MSGKGSKPRPYSVDLKTFDSNWDKIFNKKKSQDNDLKQQEVKDQDKKEGNKNEQQQ